MNHSIPEGDADATTKPAMPWPGEELRALASGTMAVTDSQALELACEDMIARWRHGHRLPAEAYRALHPALRGPTPEAFELIYNEYAVRLELGERPELQEFLWRFPDYAEPLRLQVELDQVLGAADASAPDSATTTATNRSEAAGSAPATGTRAGEPWPEIPGFQIRSVLGRGGMGVVYLAYQEGLDRFTAIKMVAPSGAGSPDAAPRFLAEAQAIARIRHPNVVQIHSTGDHAWGPYFVMEHIEGGSLASRLDGVPRPPFEAARLVERLARGIASAHELGVVHRDLKPANVLLSADGAPKVADFGLAKLLATDSGLTKTDSILGSPSYMAPEQAEAKNHEVGPAADIYALGAIFYELLTGRPPFRGATVLQTLELVKATEPVLPSRLAPAIPRDAETICLKCLAKEPAKRYLSAEALARDLERFLEGRPIQARRIGWLERGWRWAKRRPEAAVPLAAFVLALVMGTIGVAWGWRTAERERGVAERERNAAQRLSVSLALDRATEVGDRGESAEALLRMVEALRAVPEHAEDLDSAIRSNLTAWADRMHALIQILKVESRLKRAVMRPDGRVMLIAHHSRTRMIDVQTGADAIPPILSKGDVASLSFRNDGRRFLIGSGDRAQVYDGTTGKAVGAAIEHPGEGIQGVFSPDGRRIATASWSSDIRFWDAETGERLDLALRDDDPLKEGKPDEVFSCLAFSPDGGSLAAGRSNRNSFESEGSARIFDLTTGRPLGPPLPHPQRVICIAFSPDGTRIATGSGDDSARVWDARGGGRIGANMSHPADVNLVDFLPDGRTLATGSAEGQVRFWDAASGRGVGSLPRQESSATALGISPSGDRVFLGSFDGLIRIWSLAPLATPFANPHLGDEAAGQRLGSSPSRSYSRLAFSSDRRIALIGGREGFAQAIDVATERPLGPPLRHRWAGISKVALSPDGSRAVTAANDATINSSLALWNTSDGALIARLPHLNWISAMAFSPNGEILATGGYGRAVQLWDAKTGRSLGPPLPQKAVVKSLAFDASGEHLLVETYEVPNQPQGVRLWSVSSLRVVGAFRPEGEVVAVSPDSRTILTARDDQLQVRDFASGTAIGAALALGHSVAAADFSQDGALLATGGVNGHLQLWDARSGQPIRALPRQDSKITAIAFSPDRRFLLTGSGDGAVQLWGLAAFQPIGPPVGHSVSILGLAFRPDSRSFVTAATDGDARGWLVPEQASGDAETLARQLQVRTGFEMRDGVLVSALSLENWRSRRNAGPAMGHSLWGETPSNNQSEHERTARNALSLNDGHAALWHLDRIAAVAPNDGRIAAQRALALLFLNRLQDAETECARALKLGPKNVVLDGLRLQALKLIADHRKAQARRLLEIVLQAEPEDWRIAWELDRLDDDASSTPQPMRSKIEALTDSEALLDLAERRSSKSAWAEAARCYSRAARVGPLSIIDRDNQVLIELTLGDQDSYRRTCEELLASLDSASPSMTNSLSWDLALGPNGLKNYSSPIAKMKAILKALPQEAASDRRSYLNTLGVLLYRAGAFEEAARCLEESVAANQGNSELGDQVFLALAHHRLNHAQAAAHWVSKLQDPAARLANAPLRIRLEEQLLYREARETLNKNK